MKTISILLADDHAMVREGTREILEHYADLRVVGEAEDGEQAVQLALRLRPDVVLMDIGMPRVNGIDATRRIKSQCPQVAILVLTAYDDDQYVIAILQAGAAGYLLKSARGSELVEAVRAVNAGESVLHPSVARKVVGASCTAATIVACMSRWMLSASVRWRSCAWRPRATATRKSRRAW
jgi:DNA-binding NarL/FixJ family response regulator